MASPLPSDPYRALGVPKDASLPTIRSAYRKLVLTCHPDKVYDESVKEQKADQFHSVQQAYEILSDDTKRSHYDERVKLAELRAELMSQPGGRNRVVPEFGQRPSHISKYETRDNVIYEERIPRRSYEDDYVSPRHDEHRASSKDIDDRYEPASARRRTGRMSDKDRRPRDYEELDKKNKMAERLAKAAREYTRIERSRTRDRERRQDHDDKYYHARVDDGSDSESDGLERVSASRRPETKRSYRDSRRSAREEFPIRKSYDDDEDSNYEDDHESRIQSKFNSAADYIHQAKGKPIYEVEERRRPSLTKINTGHGRAPPVSPTIPRSPPKESKTRSPSYSRGVRDTGHSMSSGRDRRQPEIVEPPLYEPRRPALHPTTSAPSTIRIPQSPVHKPSRASTMETRHSEAKTPLPPKRSQTTPLGYMVSPPRHYDAVPLKSSRLRNGETHDSGYSSPGTPEMHHGASPHTTTTKYQYLDELDEDNEVPSPRVVSIEPDHRRDREVSPPPHSRSERLSASARLASHVRVPIHRSSTAYSAEPASSRPAAPSRATSSRQLFGAIDNPPVQQYKIHHFSPKLEPSDIQYSHARRNSDRGSTRDHRDAKSYQAPRSSRDTHPGMGERGGSYVKQESVRA